jgi:hypothetical protein
MIVALAILVLSPAANANTSISVYGYTDKSHYNPGDTVTLTAYLYEGGTDTINLVNVTVRYPWYTIVWGGNQTINTTAAIAGGKSWNFTAKFTIPTDGRASWGNSITIFYYYKVASTLGSGSANIQLNIDSVPAFVSFENMGNLVTILTVGTVLLIISALIIAAAILLSKRGPKAEWKTEPKA